MLALKGRKFCHSAVSRSRRPSYCASAAAVSAERYSAVIVDCTKRKIATDIIPRIPTASMISSNVKPIEFRLPRRTFVKAGIFDLLLSGTKKIKLNPFRVRNDGLLPFVVHLSTTHPAYHTL